MSPKFDVPGLPDGTITIPQPATCPELADIYNAPLCAFDHELTLIPMRELANTGDGFPIHLVLLGTLVISFAAITMILIGMWRTRDRTPTSRDCRAGAHESCAASGSCEGCPCHEAGA